MIQKFVFTAKMAA